MTERVSLRNERLFSIQKSINMIHHIKIRREKHGIILIDVEKAFHKIQQPFRKNALSKLGYKGTSST